MAAECVPWLQDARDRWSTWKRAVQHAPPEVLLCEHTTQPNGGWTFSLTVYHIYNYYITYFRLFGFRKLTSVEAADNSKRRSREAHTCDYISCFKSESDRHGDPREGHVRNAVTLQSCLGIVLRWWLSVTFLLVSVHQHYKNTFLPCLWLISGRCQPGLVRLKAWVVSVPFTPFYTNSNLTQLCQLTLVFDAYLRGS